MKKNLLFAVLSAAFLSSPAWAEDEAKDEDAVSDKCARQIAHTVFVSDKTGSRKKGSAEKISESHDNAESQGWDFEDMEIYIEDGDLQGFFITYTKPSKCSQQ